VSCTWEFQLWIVCTGRSAASSLGSAPRAGSDLRQLAATAAIGAPQKTFTCPPPATHQSSLRLLASSTPQAPPPTPKGACAPPAHTEPRPLATQRTGSVFVRSLAALCPWLYPCLCLCLCLCLNRNGLLPLHHALVLPLDPPRPPHPAPMPRARARAPAGSARAHALALSLGAHRPLRPCAAAAPRQRRSEPSPGRTSGAGAPAAASLGRAHSPIPTTTTTMRTRMIPRTVAAARVARAMARRRAVPDPLARSYPPPGYVAAAPPVTEPAALAPRAATAAPPLPPPPLRRTTLPARHSRQGHRRAAGWSRWHRESHPRAAYAGRLRCPGGQDAGKARASSASKQLGALIDSYSWTTAREGVGTHRGQRPHHILPVLLLSLHTHTHR
jgi:hypothetical protein